VKHSRCWVLTIAPEYTGAHLPIAMASLRPCWHESERRRAKG
jgi:hypothetical protein